MALKQANRQLTVATPLGEDVLVLTAFAGREEISRLFSFHLDFISDNASISATDIVGKTLTVNVVLADGSTRYFHGHVSRFFAGDQDLDKRRNYRAEVVPWLWFLTRTSDCRIFQQKSAPDIIQQIFKDQGFSDFKVQLGGKHPMRDYCVQYRETDFNFVSRLMEEEGIFYFFQHEEDKHTLVLADQKSSYVDCPENQVDYPRDPGKKSIEDHLTRWEHRYEFRTGKWTQTDYNYEDHPARSAPLPAKLMMTTESTTIDLPEAKKFEFYDYPGTYAKKDEGDGYTKLRMEEEEVEYDVVHAASNCRTFFSGGKFKVRQHIVDAEKGKGCVITAIEHSASEGYETGDEGTEFDYHNSFTCIPDSVVFRPARTTPKPMIHGVQPAVVTGPPGEEIYPDKLGRVKVQFFWDREGKRDDKSSCWVRVSQEYAGKGWGSLAIPRIGQEVLISFLEGDPDRPIITGRVYNADQTPPKLCPGLPAASMVTGLKSNSTPGGGGYNQMSMDDTKGKEQIVIHAQYDMHTTVEHDVTETIHNDRTITVDGKHTETVTKDTTIKITEGKYNHDVVANTADYHVQGKLTEKVDNDQETTVANNVFLRSTGGTIREEAQAGDFFVYAKNNVEVKGDTAMVVVIAGQEIRLQTGSSVLSMKSDGTIKLSGVTIEISASTQAKLGVGSQNITCDTQKAAIGGSAINSSAVGMHEITGALVKIN
ncbi:MAG: type VI secretion system Vgr family protein [Thermoguttaceae bacterium]